MKWAIRWREISWRDGTFNVQQDDIEHHVEWILQHMSDALSVPIAKQHQGGTTYELREFLVPSNLTGTPSMPPPVLCNHEHAADLLPAAIPGMAAVSVRNACRRLILNDILPGVLNRG